MLKNKDYVKKLWREIDNSEDLNIYIHSPFCMNQCRYCVYKGQMGCSEEEKKTFADLQLIPNIVDFHDIFSKHKINTIYFGGGTPNAFSTQTIDDICKSIPEFQYAANRVIEINPAFCDEKYIEEICNIGFTLVTFGIQSFNEKALLRQGRPYCSFEKLMALVGVCKKHGVRTSLDIMCYLETYTAKDLTTFLIDVDIAKKSNVDFFTVYPELNLILNDANSRDAFIETLSQCDVEGYYRDDTTMDIDGNPRSICRFIKDQYSYDFFLKNILSYYENDFPYATQNIIGFGDNHCRQEIVSYSPRKFFYAEKNTPNRETMYDIRYDKEPLR